MRYWTYAEIRDKVRKDLGIQQETFVTDPELLDYANAGIDEAESEIHSLYEDYFLTRTTETLVNGQAAYDMPSNIYGNKLRGLVYKNGNEVYQIPRFKDRANMFAELEYDNDISGADYQYILRNDSASLGIKAHLVPTPDEDVADGLIFWYIRNANRLTDGDSICDIPEFTNFVIQYCKVRCYEKEGNPMMTQALQVLEHFRKNMISTLTDMTPDGDTTIEQDLTFYSEMEGYYGI